jgi:peptidyl-prolyl cis-trans isomerase C
MRHVVPVLAAVLLAACGEPSTGKDGATPIPLKPVVEPGDPIAKIGGTVLSVEGLQKRMNDQSPFVRARYNTPERKKEFLDAQVRFEVLANEAVARGYQNDPEVQDALKKIIVQKLTREEFDGRVKLSDITDDDLKKYYDAHQADYAKPAMARASDLFVAFGADKAAAKKKADEARKKAADPAKLEDRAHFKDLVTQYSDDAATKQAGGDLRYLSVDEVKERLGAPAAEWLFASETMNEVSPVLEGKDGFHVVKRTGHRKAITRTFEQVKSQIRNVLYRERRTSSFNQFVEDLKKKQGVEVFADKLGKVQVSTELPPGAVPSAGGHEGHGHGMDEGAPPDDAPPGAPPPAPGAPADKDEDEP